MLIRASERRARLSVRELAEFATGPMFGTDGPPSGRWRAEVGHAWHERIRAQIAAIHPGARFEVPVEGILVRDHWHIVLNGRIDQIIEDTNGGVILQEVKSVCEPLPTDPAELLRLHPSYFRQAALYLRLWQLNTPEDEIPARARLLFVHIEEGITQVVDLTAHARAHADTALDAFLEFANERRGARMRVRKGSFDPPFAQLRDDQAAVLPALRERARRPGVHGFEAPTGFGKTGLVLNVALEALRDGLCERVIYLTGKSTGQIQVCRQLETMLAHGGFARYFQIRNRAEHGDPPFGTETLTAAALRERWERSGLRPHALFEAATVPLARVIRTASEAGIPAYALSRSILPFAEVWVGDYNYVFSPSASGVFFNQPGFDPRQTFLIIDEAHNLASRVESGWSFVVDADRLDSLAAATQFLRFPGRLPRALHALADHVRQCKSGKAIDADDRALFSGLLDEAAGAAQRVPWSPEELTEAMWIDLQEIITLQQSLARTGLRFLLWTQTPGKLRVDCIDAASEIGACIAEFRHVLMTSATLQPENSLRAACGLQRTRGATRSAKASEPFLSAHSPWREEACTVAIDASVDTRFSQRAGSRAATARTIAHWCAQIPTPLAVFFPSYQYARDVVPYVEALNAGLRVAIPPRGLDLPEQERFIEEALISAHALFLILGSGYTESINLLGGRVSDALVVSPALPEVNPVQEARMDEGPWSDREQAFHEVYRVPGMIRINQALGRLVREPGHRARILLQCARFRDPAYRALLAPEYRSEHILENAAQVDAWLHDSAPDFRP